MKPIHPPCFLLACVALTALLAATPAASQEASIAETGLTGTSSTPGEAPVAAAAEPTPPAKAAAAKPLSPDDPGNLLDQLRYDFLYVVASPARMGPLGWGLTAGVAASVYFARDNRQAERDWWEQHVRCQTTDSIASWVQPYGSTYSPLAASALFLAAGAALDRPHEFETGIELAESEFYTLALTSLGQFILSEDRPCQGGAEHILDGHIGHGISGHSSAAAALAGPLNRQYLQLSDNDSSLLYAGKIAGKVLVYGVPVLVGLSRVNGDSHYLWNVLAGWAIGYTMGELIPNAHEAKKAGRSWWISPVADDKAVGVAFQTTW